LTKGRISPKTIVEGGWEGDGKEGDETWVYCRLVWLADQVLVSASIGKGGEGGINID